MILRLIILVVICALGYALYKKLQEKSADKTLKRSKDEPPLPMRRCAKCGVHLPENDSIQYQTLHFCCEDHKKAYLEDRESGDNR